MKTMHGGSMLAGALLGISVAGTASARYAAAVWVRVQSVTSAPSEASADGLVIHAAVMVYVGGSTGKYPGYTDPATGYLYYECPVGKEADCKLEWPDIKNSIAKPPGECIGLGDQSLPTGSLRVEGVTPANPDAYPV